MAEVVRTLGEISLEAWKHARSAVPEGDVHVIVVVVVPNDGSALGHRGSFHYQYSAGLDGTLFVGTLTRVSQEVHLHARQVAEEQRMLAELSKLSLSSSPPGEL